MDREIVQRFIDLAVRDRSGAERLLREHPELIGARYIHGETPLHFCAVEGFTEGVRVLAEAGVPIDAMNEFGDTALHDAVRLGNLDVVKLLLCFGADPNLSSSTDGNPLHVAVRRGHVALVEVLLDAGARPDYVTDLGETIWDAAKVGRLTEQVMRALETRGINP